MAEWTAQSDSVVSALPSRLEGKGPRCGLARATAPEKGKHSPTSFRVLSCHLATTPGGNLRDVQNSATLTRGRDGTTEQDTTLTGSMRTRWRD